MFFKDEKVNTYVVSIIWGLGIAAVLRKVCSNNKCVVIKAPKDMDSYQEKHM